MILSLADILAAQQVQRPDVANVLSSLSATPDSSFKNLVSAPAKANKVQKDDAPADSFPNPAVDNNQAVTQINVPNEPAKSNNSNDNNDAQVNQVISGKNNVANDVEAPAQNADTAGKSFGEVLLQQQEVLTQAFDTLKAAKDSGSAVVANVVASAVNAGQQSDVAANLSLSGRDNSAVLDLVGNAVNDVVQVLTGGAAKVVDTAANVVQELDGKSVLTQALSGLEVKPNVAAPETKVENAPQVVTQQAPVTTTQVASAILNIAQTVAQNPLVVQDDVKSGQIDSLLKETKENKEGKLVEAAGVPKVDGDVQSVIKAVEGSAHSADKQQNLLTNTTLANNQLAQIQIAKDNLGAQNAAEKDNAAKAVEAAPKQGNDLLLQAGLNNVSDVPSVQDFVKLNNYIDTVSNIANNMNANRGMKAEDVMAQIKFGVSQLAGKNESNISIQLSPKELGTVDVRMEISSDGKTKVSIMAERADTLNLLQKEATSLKAILQDVLHTESSQMSFSFHQNDDSQWKQMMNEAFNGYGVSGGSDVDESLINPAIYQRNFIANDSLDIRV
jgi:hypothetical protein